MVLMEQEALKNADQKSKQIAFAQKFLKEKLEQEERNTRKSLKAINAQFRVIMRQAKAEELKKEIEILRQTFERQLDFKEDLVKAYVLDLQEAEEQEAVAVRSHVQQVDRLVDFQGELSEQLHAEFGAELDEIKAEFHAERDMVLKHHEKELTDLRDVLFALQTHYNDENSEAMSEFNSKRDDVRTRNLEARSTLKANLEGQVAGLWEQFSAALKHYETSTADKRSKFERLRERDQQSAATISSQLRRLTRLQDEIADVKARLADNAKNSQQRNKDLLKEKDSVRAHFQALKQQMNQARAQARRDLTKMTVEADECQKDLEKRVALGERIIKRAEMCRKLETEAEKVLPFYEETVSQSEVETLGGEPLPPPVEAVPVEDGDHSTMYTEERRLVAGHAVLDSFWKRYNKVMLDKLAVEKERDAREQTNLQLRAVLKQYLDGIAVNEEVLAQANSLFVINGRTNAPLAPPVGEQRVKPTKGYNGPVVVEAQQSLKATAKMTR